MNKEQSIEPVVVKKIGIILVVTVMVVFLVLWALLYGMGNDSVRRFTSYFQSGTQVFFDEGRFGQGLYAAKVTAYDAGRQIEFGGQSYVKGSTLPDVNETNQYPVVATAGIPFKRGQHYGSVTNEVYQSKTMPALILNPGQGGFDQKQGLPVATVSENISPYAGNNYRLKQASHIHVHPGRSANERGSAACLTIDPEQAQVFFESEIGQTGTLHIRR